MKNKGLLKKLDLVFFPSSLIRKVKKKDFNNTTNKSIVYGLSILGEIGRISLYYNLIKYLS